MAWKKGQSGNLKGRPKAEHTIAEVARKHGPEMVEVLYKIATEGSSDAARTSAASAILDRGYGKPPQFNTGDSAAFKRAMEMSDDELATIASGQSPSRGNGADRAPDGAAKPH